ncbi:hypothetical protein ACMD2_24934 [Ananas comosus]|uniref:Uncharacterized protein n=1 Tax=Ananas comosus TaxID=4615 RepID=A0A199UV32_ANACO|nr:hypothetical protein ACMD2_24934 [Ananas comosus]
MLVLSQAPNGALSARRCPSPSPSSLLPKPYSASPLFSKPTPKFPLRNPRIGRRGRSPPPPLTPRLSLSSADDAAGPSTRPLPSAAEDGGGGGGGETVFVGDDEVPLEGVIQFEKPRGVSSKLLSSAQVGLLAGGDVLCLLIFSAVGRFSHGFAVLDFETLKTADPFIAGWILSAYFLGAYGDDGKGTNGSMKAITAAAKSWAVGIPLGIIIRAVTSGHIPPINFILVTMASTGVLLLVWRALVSNLLSGRQSKQNDVYRQGSPFELFELLTSLVRRW